MRCVRTLGIITNTISLTEKWRTQDGTLAPVIHYSQFLMGFHGLAWASRARLPSARPDRGAGHEKVRKRLIAVRFCAATLIKRLSRKILTNLLSHYHQPPETPKLHMLACDLFIVIPGSFHFLQLRDLKPNGVEKAVFHLQLRYIQFCTLS